MAGSLSRSDDGYAFGGEFVSMPERVLVAPSWGTFHRGGAEEGDKVRRGAELGWITGVEGQVPLCAPVAGVFEIWMALEGQLVGPGTALLSIRRRARRR